MKAKDYDSQNFPNEAIHSFFLLIDTNFPKYVEDIHKNIYIKVIK